ncbi:MAG: SPOR domain-containing protein [Caldimicrobium sp.]|nr:SPOR domain-containing protein [Caldimicrobium sp.]MCX7613224.1 SPOR domain-containing protein [Caldimicrobium sp.]MDW8182474.1 SPOR domain-containing protein [Caldimicrobium sp.]
MEEKKVKFELSRVALIFVVLFGLCILIWTFILGVWIGTKIGGKRVAEEVALDKKPEIPPLNVPAITSNVTNVTNETAKITNETKAVQNETSIAKVDNTTKEVMKEEGIKKEVPLAEKPKKSVESKPVKEAPEYKRKEVAQLATKIKEEPAGKFSLQVGAFSQKDKADQMVNKIKGLGYSAELKEVTQEGKILYKVYLGKFGSREEAEKAIPIAKERLGVEKPFIVESK